jgi:hypothetical protein
LCFGGLWQSLPWLSLCLGSSEPQTDNGTFEFTLTAGVSRAGART